jgi:hypothetical protein
MDLVEFLEKNQKLHIQIVAVTLKIQDSVGKTNFFLGTLPFSPWTVSAQLLIKYMKNELNTRFEQNFTTGSYGIGIGRSWCSRKACEICSSLV